MANQIQYRGLESEMEFQTSRSSGPGGQNVNKVESKVTLRFNVPNSILLSDAEKERLTSKLSLTSDGDLMIQSQESRSQVKNKETAIRKFYETLKGALAKRKIRKATRPSKASQRKRLDSKKKHGEKKKLRGNVDF